MFAQMYKAGGQELDLHAPAAPEPGVKGQINAMVDRLAQWYVDAPAAKSPAPGKQVGSG